MGRNETLRLAQHLTNLPIESDQAERLYTETEGTPLFIVETVRGGLDVTDPALTDDTVSDAMQHVLLPSKVLAVITSRLSAISPEAHEVLCVAAVIGRSFTFEELGTQRRM